MRLQLRWLRAVEYTSLLCCLLLRLGCDGITLDCNFSRNHANSWITLGHSGEIFACRFDPTGNLIASGSMDRDILLWRTFGQCENYGILTGHKGAVLDLHWSRDSRVLFSASADKMLASWDLETGTRIRRHTGHEEIINCMDVSKRGEELLVSGSDDGYIGVSSLDILPAWLKF